MGREKENKTFNRMTWIFGIIFVISIALYGINLKQDVIKEKWNGFWEEDEPQTQKPSNLQNNVSQPLSSVNNLNSFADIIIVITIILFVLGVVFSVFNTFKRILIGI